MTGNLAPAPPPDGSLVLRGIGRLLPMSADPVADSIVVVHQGRVAYAGDRRGVPGPLLDALPTTTVEVDAGGAAVVPGFVDAHTHLIYAGVRRDEFVARLAGESYDGGGIRLTVEATRAASDEELLERAVVRAREAMRHGTTTMEIKSGYGLEPEHELRILRVAGEVGRTTGLRVETTYLGAHVVPAGRDGDEYVEEVVATVPAAAAAGAQWVDVFCDRGVFTVEQARRVLAAGAGRAWDCACMQKRSPTRGPLGWRRTPAARAPTISST